MITILIASAGKDIELIELVKRFLVDKERPLPLSVRTVRAAFDDTRALTGESVLKEGTGGQT